MSEETAAVPAPAPPAPAAPPAEGLLGRLLALRQASILTSRYVDLKLGDPAGLAILLLQAPLIGWLTSLAFDGKKEDKTFDFILVIVAVWFGCFNGCREVVKERLIFMRERRAGVTVRAYLLSKLMVLALVATLQCLVLLALATRTVRLEASLPLMFLTLLSTALAATALGLLISSVVRSQSAAMAIVPIVLIPQLIFSKVTLQNPPPVVRKLDQATVAHWGYEVLEELRRERPEWDEALLAELALLGMTVGFLSLAGLCLRVQDE